MAPPPPFARENAALYDASIVQLDPASPTHLMHANGLMLLCGG